jgi:hypothetical protein
VHEDNAGALALANCPQLTPRSKHYAVQYHFFKSHVKQGTVKVVKVSTDLQAADLLTKGLTREKFEFNRKLTMGW